MKYVLVGNFRRKSDGISRDINNRYTRIFVGSISWVSSVSRRKLSTNFRGKFLTVANILNYWISDEFLTNNPKHSNDIFFTVLEPFKFFKFLTEFRQHVRRKCQHIFLSIRAPLIHLIHSSFSLHPLHSLSFYKSEKILSSSNDFCSCMDKPHKDPNTNLLTEKYAKVITEFMTFVQ